MKKEITLIAAMVAGTAGAANAQSLTAGWDFSQYSTAAGPGFSTTDGSTFTDSVNANYSEFGSPQQDKPGADWPDANDFGTFHYDGTNGSSTFDLNNKDVSPQGGGDLTVADRGFFGAGGSLNTLEAQGQPNTNSLGLGFQDSVVNGKAFTLAIDLANFDGGSLGSGWSLSFGAVNDNDADNSSTIGWAYSTDGSSFTDAGITTNVSNTAQEKTVDLSSVSALDDQTTVFFQGTLNGVEDNSTTFVDNFGVDATTVPEPSTYAAIAGVLALGLAAYRRHRRG